MKKWFFIMFTISFLLFGSVIGFNLFKERKIAEYLANASEPVYPVTVIDTKGSQWTPTIQSIGFIEPNQGVTLTTQTSGVVDSVKFRSGQKVKKGEVLITLDSEVEKANLASNQARLPAVKAKFERYKDLLKKGSVSRESYDDAEASYHALLAEITSLKATVKRRTITAPFSGTVGIRKVFLGQYLQPGNDVVRLEDVETMRLRFTITQRDISKISLGQAVNIEVDSYPNTAFSGHITAIEPAINYQSGLVQVQADIPNNDGQLRAGMYARANILLPSQKNQIVIPQTAITYALYGNTVFVVQKDDKGELRAYQKVVTTGDRQGANVHVLAGISTNEQIVTSGQIRLSNESKVKLVENNALDTPATTPKL